MLTPYGTLARLRLNLLALSLRELAEAIAGQDKGRLVAAEADVRARADDWGRAREMAAGEGTVTA